VPELWVAFCDAVGIVVVLETTAPLEFVTVVVTAPSAAVVVVVVSPDDDDTPVGDNAATAEAKLERGDAELELAGAALELVGEVVNAASALETLLIPLMLID
jgi:hypothetical protein